MSFLLAQMRVTFDCVSMGLFTLFNSSYAVRMGFSRLLRHGPYVAFLRARSGTAPRPVGPRWGLFRVGGTPEPTRPPCGGPWGQLGIVTVDARTGAHERGRLEGDDRAGPKAEEEEEDEEERGERREERDERRGGVRH